MTHSRDEGDAWKKEPARAFSDGALAISITITIMVLELEVPHGSDMAALKPLLPVFPELRLKFHPTALWRGLIGGGFGLLPSAKPHHRSPGTALAIGRDLPARSQRETLAGLPRAGDCPLVLPCVAG